MPLTRYQIRSEYGFADPELYRAADKDDPEALLEGVAMAGLVGVLRQLGDLAEFAAEIFHDLHEEVLATASRGHGLMIRVQQLETEFPLIEKALLSQTNHPSFFCNAGVDWHPNMHSQQNLISQGDLPRFIMDSYEECRAPPRLFLLDKFDVAGAGACLKRYSDPSFFRIEAAVDEVQRERKMRRVKKKGIRGRNGETPEVMPASHAKLQQLFLEESIENSFSNNPARLVKLKKRPLKESPFCSKSGKSYMEKFVEIPSPESKTVCEVPVAPQSLKWTTGNGNESDHQVLDLNMLSPKKTLSEEEGTSRSIRQALSQKSSPGRMDGMVCNQKEMEDPEPTPYNYINESATLHEAAEKELIDVEGEVGQGIDSWNSDEITSEVENYMDALATMESETETDNEYRAKKPKAFSSNRRDTDSETNEEQTELQAQFSDSQSLGYSASDDGNTSLIKGSSSFSYSDSQGNVVENVASDAEGNATGFVNTETSASGFLSVASNQLSAHEETSKIEESHEPLVPKHTGREDDEISDLGESSIISCPTDLNLKLSHSFQGQSLLVESASNGIAAVTTDADRRKKDDTVPTVATESHPTIELGDAGAPSSILELPPGPKSSNSHEEELYDEHEGADHTRIMTNREMSAPCCDLSSLEGQPQFLVLSEPNEPPDLKSLTDSSVASLTCNLDVANLHSANSETDAPPISGKVNLESSVVHEDNEQTDLQERQSISLACDFPVERNSQDADVQQQEEIVKFANNAQVVVAMSVNKTSSTKEAVEDNAVALDFPFSPLSDDNVNIDDAVGQETPLEALGLSTSVIGVTDDEGRNSVNLITDTMRSPLMDFNDPASEFEILSLQKCHSGEEFSPECSGESKCPTNEQDFVYAGSNPSLSDSISHLETGSETGMDSSFLEQFSTKFAPDDFRTGLGISELGKEELQSKPSPDGYPTCYREDVPSSNIYEKVDLEETVDQRSDEQAHELDVNLSCEEASNSQTSNSYSEQTQSGVFMEPENILVPKTVPTVECPLWFQDDISLANCLQDDKEGSQSLCLQSGQVQSSDSIDTEKCVDASESCSKDQPEQSPSLGVDSTTSVSPQSDAAEVNLEEVLLLPPSPPSERGLGKFSFPLLQQSLPVEGNFPYQISASEGGLGQDLHPQINVEDEKLQFEPQKDNLTLSCPSPLQSQVLDDCSLIQYKTSMVEATDVPNHLPTNVPSEHAFPESGREMVQSNFKCISSDLAVEDGLCRQDPRPSEVEVIQATQSSPAASSEDKVQQHCSNKLEVVHESSIDVSEPSLKQNEHLQHDLLKSDGERAVEATSTQTEVEVGQQNGSLVNDIPRPPKHLIEAVAAHDRSMLRKVTERIQPQIEPKVTERDSLLEQIRTKSFNLKPAHVTRPSIQGPKTNLRVAAILEKANAIRQAFAGSDEDDDDDSWSDS